MNGRQAESAQERRDYAEKNEDSPRGLRGLCVSAVKTPARKSIWFALMFSVCVVFLTLEAAGPPPTVASMPQGNDLDYSKFLHTSQRHGSLACSSCHHRTDNSVGPSFPSHPDCIECHSSQFLTPGIPMCSICHVNTPAPLKPFPGVFKETFNIKFDHAQHMTGSARPQGGCAFCHNSPLRAGAALAIPTGLSAHARCYVCHTPTAQAGGHDIGSCSTCHEQKPYARTSTAGNAFRLSFSHAQHGARQRLGCVDCHSYTAGLRQSQQVSSPRAVEHFPSRGSNCATCHGGKRSFGGDLDFKDCRRCHTGSGFRMGTRS
jgi:c(7)-type cytochrome triheme protein